MPKKTRNARSSTRNVCTCREAVTGIREVASAKIGIVAETDLVEVVVSEVMAISIMSRHRQKRSTTATRTVARVRPTTRH